MKNGVVYIVIEDNGLNYEDYEEEIKGVFDNYEKAEQVKLFLEDKEKNAKKDYCHLDYNYNIVEYQLNVFEHDLNKFEIDNEKNIKSVDNF